MENTEVHDGANWSQQYGAECPVCGYFTRFAYCHLPWQDGIKTRYHRCPHCNNNFKSIALDPVAREKIPEPEQLKYLRYYRGQVNIIIASQ